MDEYIVRRLEEYRNSLRLMKLEEPHPPWRYLTFVHLGGVYEVGYGASSDLLLIVTANGRGVVDCITGERLVRDHTNISEDWYDPIGLVADGIGPLVDQRIRLAGIHGGGLLWTSPDWWSLELVAPDWPLSFILLNGPEFKDGHHVPDTVKVAPRHGDDEIIAFGFSPIGRSFVVVMSHGMEIFVR